MKRSVLAAAALALANWGTVADDSATAVEFRDGYLRGQVERVLGKRPGQRITRADMEDLTSLGASRVGRLDGIEHAINLVELSVRNGTISDLAPLAGLTSLESLGLSGNAIEDVSALGSLESLQWLDLSGNAVEDISALESLESLTYLRLDDNAIEDVSALGSLESLVTLFLSDNAIGVGVSALGSLESLRWLYLNNNEIEDVSALGSLESLTTLWLHGNKIVDVSALGSLESLTYLRLNNNEITDVSALGSLGNLYRLELSGNAIEDVSALGSLPQMNTLDLSDNEITDVSALGSLRDGVVALLLSDNAIVDVSALGSLESLRWLELSGNAISDVSALESLEYLTRLYLSDTQVTDLTPLAGMQQLEYLRLNDTQVTDLTPLDFGPLVELHLRNNAVQDLSPLLMSGDSLYMVDARGVPQSGEALSVWGTLRERGATVLAGEAVPYFPAAGGTREGFARIINRSDVDGEVLIAAVDDADNRFGPARMDVGARRTVHFNSRDLEDGNAAKGLRDGVGRPTAGDWRLEVTSPLDIEVLSYLRTDDGFVTAMHDVAASTRQDLNDVSGGVAPVAMLPFFNPGSNESQRSILRMLNMWDGGRYFRFPWFQQWTLTGYDDRGVERSIRMATTRGWHARTFTARDLENWWRDGHGKWRLVVPGFPWLAMSLLESPTGHLANLSTTPDNAEPLAGGGARHRVPLFPAAGGARHGFVRVINRSRRSGDVAIAAVDDAGNRSGPARLEIGRRQTAHFNSSDLEAGNAAKGLSGGVGMGEGDWRLELTSTLDLQVLSYVRTADGFVTSMHDLAPGAADGSHRVVFFNPGSNSRQVSKLRLVNDGGRAASATIAGVDDGGSDSGMVAVTVPAGQALTFTSAQLEAGGGALSGGLGDGSGKWRLRVESDAPLSVMSLLESPTGHLANVSTGTKD